MSKDSTFAWVHYFLETRNVLWISVVFFVFNCGWSGSSFLAHVSNQWVLVMSNVHLYGCGVLPKGARLDPWGLAKTSQVRAEVKKGQVKWGTVPSVLTVHLWLADMQTQSKFVFLCVDA